MCFFSFLFFCSSVCSTIQFLLYTLCLSVCGTSFLLYLFSSVLFFLLLCSIKVSLLYSSIFLLNCREFAYAQRKQARSINRAAKLFIRSCLCCKHCWLWCSSCNSITLSTTHKCRSKAVTCIVRCRRRRRCRRAHHCDCLKTSERECTRAVYMYICYFVWSIVYIHSAIRSFVHSFVCSFLRSFVRYVCGSLCSCICLVYVCILYICICAARSVARFRVLIEFGCF